MAVHGDRTVFRNEDLILSVSAAVDRRIWNEDRYEAFLDELCGSREYQKAAIKTALRYLLGKEHSSLRALARANFDTNPNLESCYGSWTAFERQLQMPDQLAGSLDLATGAGKSYTLYGIAAIMLAEGVVDRVLVLCPSTTIEAGLTEKFRSLAGNEALRSLLPGDAVVIAPAILSGDQTLTVGGICVENFHAILEHVGSSIRDSLAGHGDRTLILNDEAHHVANEVASKAKRWKEFVLDPNFGFRYVIGVSGTCYVQDQYFADVIYRYSLRQAMDDRYVKQVDYVAEMPRAGDPEDKWQLINNRHEAIRASLSSRGIRPLTLIVTGSIARCEDVSDELRHFLVEHGGCDYDEAKRRVLSIYSGSTDLPKLGGVDGPGSPVEWIVSVSMLTEGWDVKRVFQIVPHEERAFNSKLLVAQVLGRGLRIPDGWTGDPPEVTVFNHDAWADKIRHLVNEMLERERRLTSKVLLTSPHHFELHQIEYSLTAHSISKPMEGEYTLFAKGFVDLATDNPIEETSIEFERASTGERRRWQTRIERRAYSAWDIAQSMYARLEEARDEDEPDFDRRDAYINAFPLEKLVEIVETSLTRVGASSATDAMRQKFLQSLGPLRRKVSETVRYTQAIERHFTVSTEQRPSESLSISDLRRSKAIFFTDQTGVFLDDEQRELFDEVSEPGAGYRAAMIANRFDFKTPLTLAIADSENERRFMTQIAKPENALALVSWIKSTATRFYEIDYAWKKGAHAKRGKFSPDFFVRLEDQTIVVEVKGEEEVSDPSIENVKKNEFALAHFVAINSFLEASNNPHRYKLTFVTPTSFNAFFQALRDGTLSAFRSELDVKLSAESEDS